MNHHEQMNSLIAILIDLILIGLIIGILRRLLISHLSNLFQRLYIYLLKDNRL